MWPLSVTVLLCAFSCATVRADCNYDSIGSMVGHKIQLSAKIPPNQHSGRMYLTVCAGFKPNGATVSACDSTLPPTITFKNSPYDIVYADITRNGPEYGSVSVYGTVYCPYQEAEAKGSAAARPQGARGIIRAAAGAKGDSNILPSIHN